MRISWLTITALCLQNGLLVAGQAATKSGGGSKPTPGAKSLSYQRAMAQMILKTGYQPGDRAKVKWIKPDDCSDNKCTGNQVKDDKDKDGDKCKDCPKGQKPNPDHTKCIREDTGCAEDEKQKDDKTCEKCSGSQKSDPSGKNCVDSKGKKQGKCPQGQVLNPAKGGQDENTDSPSCIPDDDAKCDDGKTAATRSKKSGASADARIECGKDDNPDFQCSDKKTYQHKVVDDDGKIKSSCRTTEQTEKDKKTKYDDSIKDLKTGAANKKQADKDKKKRARGGWCFLELGLLGAWAASDLDSLSMDELDGMFELAIPDMPIPNDLGGDGTIPEWVIEYKETTLAVTSAELESAGLGGLVGGVVTATTAAGAAIAKALPKILSAGDDAAKTAIQGIKTGTRGVPSSKAVQAARGSSFVGKVLKDQRFRDCAALGVGLAAGMAADAAGDALADKVISKAQFSASDGGLMVIDFSRPNMAYSAPEGRGTMHFEVHANRHVDGTTDHTPYFKLSTKTDKRYYSDRLYYETCQQPGTDFDNKISWVEVKDGCCSFYDGPHCEANTHLFDMDRREDKWLKGKSDDAISSWWCTFEPGCKGRPTTDK